MSLAATEPLDPATQRQVAVDLFDHCWTLLRLPSRTLDQDDELLHAAHASRHHWGVVGTVANRARGEWMCSRVYAELGRPEPALYHAYRALALVEAGGEGIADWDHPAALEALARAHLAAGDAASAAATAAAARSALAGVSDADDRAVVEQDLAALGL
jgi:hypothetical protein